MPNQQRTLNDLRKEIDTLDDSLHDLLMRRSQLVQEVMAAKGPTLTGFRPAREAAILRRLTQRHKGRFPRAVVARIWREIIAASTAQQGRFSVAVLSQGEEDSLVPLARAHFGMLTPIAPMATQYGVINAVSEGSASVGVLPWPSPEEPMPAWRLLNSQEPGAPRFVARLPFICERQPLHEAVVISRAPNEPSGADNSLIRIEVSGEISRGALHQLIEGRGLRMLDLFAHKDNGQLIYLAHVRGYVDDEAPVLLDLLEADRRIDAVAPLGAYAKPLSPEDLRGG